VRFDAFRRAASREFDPDDSTPHELIAGFRHASNSRREIPLVATLAEQKRE
jgi:hypothetical protein